ncbi:two-component system response regulator [Aliidiomarina minuta]|uniref:Two-component system response regulator n=1 Tax=Aliidiomarina minuta TaxID=880057 RepID=A0A432W7X3_9GAMM|nr:response regulator [Aliidiomarina minuta]RUO26200.1 two-component system response regulator [Aliidiomarina minuta]
MALNLLLVEDKERTRVQILEILAETPYAVTQAKDGLAGLNKAKKLAFDVVIVDHKMPLMDGLALLRHLREQHSYDKTPILFMTTENVRSLEDKARKLGADAVLGKPVDKQTLLAELKSIAPRRVA